VLLPILADLTAEQLAQLLARVDETTAQGLLFPLQKEILTRCAKDGLFWLRFVQTIDEADSEHPVKPYPLYKPYVQPIWETLQAHKRIIWAKSRQMGASWELVAFCCWIARFIPHQAVYWQAQKDSDGNSMVALPGVAEGRAQFIESHLPPFMQQRVKASEGRLVWPNGSFMQALAGGANQIRGRVFSLYVGDEFAFQDEASGVYTSIAPLVQKHAKIILVSTPNGADNTFGKLYHGQTA